MKKYFIFSCFFLLVNTVYGQDTQLKWAKQFGGTIGTPAEYYKDNGTTVKTDADGNVYTIGLFRGTVDFDPGVGIYNLYSGSNSDLYISKVDSGGNFIWAGQIKGQFIGCTVYSKSFVFCSDGGILISGYFNSPVDFDPGTGTHILTSTSTEGFILKLTSNGELDWVKKINAPNINSLSAAFSINVDNNGDIIVAGIFIGLCDFDPGPQLYPLSTIGYQSDIFLLKLDANGNFIWVRTFGAGNFDWSESLDIDNTDNIYLTGIFYGTVDFDPGSGTHNLISNGGSDIFIAKLSGTGNLTWARSAGGTGSDYGGKIHADNSGYVYITGSFNGTVDFDPNAGVFNMATTNPNSTYILKLDTAANFVWAKMIEFAYQKDLTVDRSGFLYLTGSFNGLCDFDPGPLTYYMNAGYYDMFILKLNKDGNFLWVKAIGGSEDDWIESIFVDTRKNIYATGAFGDTADFDPELPVYELSVENPPSNPFIFKLGQCPNPARWDTAVATCDTFVLNNVTYSSSGTYQQVLYNFMGCDSTITLQLTVNEKPKPDLGADRKLCGSSQISPGIFDNYLWQDNSAQAIFTVTVNGQYWVTVTNSKNCKATDTLNILAVDTIPGNFLTQDKKLCIGSVLNISLPGYQSYLWSTGSASNHIQLSRPGMYFVNVVDHNNCYGSDTIFIQRDNTCLYGIPNSFTPNNDSKNDYFKPIIQQDIVDYTFMIYNRYGQKIFETKNYATGWDGKYKGKDQPAGTYVYLLAFTNGTGYKTEEKGTVFLIR